jgi:hypothetical protein
MIVSGGDLARFWAKVRKVDGDGCWEWQSSKIRKGYGTFWYGGKAVLAHRFAARMAGMDIDGRVVCHRCDNPSCVREAHLFVGTHADNIADCHRKGRAAKGSDRGQAKLTEAQVLAMREACAAGRSRRIVAHEYGVSDVTVGSIVRRETWKHI